MGARSRVPSSNTTRTDRKVAVGISCRAFASRLALRSGKSPGRAEIATVADTVGVARDDEVEDAEMVGASDAVAYRDGPTGPRPRPLPRATNEGTTSPSTTTQNAATTTATLACRRRRRAVRPASTADSRVIRPATGCAGRARTNR